MNVIPLKDTVLIGERTVKPGDLVELLPLTLHSLDIREQREQLRRVLGRGPYVIKRIGQWSDDRVFLYFEGPNGNEPGAEANKFR